jgi:para-aminobenzoate synthetase/4-amino-4-deoxychorismate lyase
MIVDMVRNDLGRVATLGSVHVPVLFEVERYATVLQMTSTVRCACAPERTTSEILAALFPCGSVTGAPKVRTMEIIHELEPFARGMYTGAIGVFMPGGDCLVNVPIRTITLDTQSGEATFNVGGGITTDSSVGDEYEECLTKTAFLTTPAVDVGLLESLLLEDGIYPLIERHLQRLQASAHYFDMTYDTAHIRAVLDACARAHPAGAWKVRLVLSCAGRADCTAEPRPRLREPWRVGFARMRVDSRDRLLYHKTTQRARYEAARRERPDCDDVILSNERGDVTEASIANIVIERDSRKLTPPLSAGLLPGVFRAALLASGAITEAPLRPDDLRRADGIWLINAVRGWVPATLVDG